MPNGLIQEQVCTGSRRPVRAKISVARLSTSCGQLASPSRATQRRFRWGRGKRLDDPLAAEEQSRVAAKLGVVGEVAHQVAVRVACAGLGNCCPGANRAVLAIAAHYKRRAESFTFCAKKLNRVCILHKVLELTATAKCAGRKGF